jgi:MOSC domain-containing protein YiiM
VVGKIVQINISSGGVPKRPIEEAHMTFDRVAGDDWRHKDIHGGPDRAVLMIAVETIEALQRDGYPVFNGALGENLTTRGIDYREIRYGDRFRIGTGVVLEVTKRRAPCRTLTVYGADIGKALFDKEANAHDASSVKWGQAGFYCKVIAEGVVRPGDTIEWNRERVVHE